jgi:hypothetical protein
MKNLTPAAILKKRVEQNYADFKAEALSLLDEEELYEMAHRLAAVKDTYEQLTSDDVLDSLDEGEVEFLLKFHNPLEMTADYLQERQAGYPVEVDEALFELFSADDHEENYLTIDFAEELIAKYGSDVRIKVALLMEAIEAGDRYLRLLKLTRDADDKCDYEELCTPFKPLDFDEDGFFVYEDEEGCF